jgi:glutathione-regulated potassium-efflux system ancillary protein KefC
MREFEVRLTSIRRLKKPHQFAGRIGTVCFHVDEEKELYRLGATFVIRPLIATGEQLAEHMLDPTHEIDSSNI